MSSGKALREEGASRGLEDEEGVSIAIRKFKGGRSNGGDPWERKGYSKECPSHWGKKNGL